MNDRYSKLAFLHRVKERKTPSLSSQASFAPSSLKLAWSGKSFIKTFSQRTCNCSIIYRHHRFVHYSGSNCLITIMKPKPSSFFNIYMRIYTWDMWSLD